MAKILAFAGSLRKDAYSKRVLRYAVDGAISAGAEVTLADLADYPMTVFNADIQADGGFDENALKFQDLLNDADAFIICTPEYNGSLPGGLKNVLDWASRNNDKYGNREVFVNKTALIMSSSPGPYGGIRALGHLRGVLTALGVNALHSEIAVNRVSTFFDGDDRDVNDEKMKLRLERLGALLVQTLA